MKMFKKLAAAGAAVMMIASMTLTATASSVESWYLYANYGAPATGRKTTHIGTVTGLYPTTDSGIDFTLTNYHNEGTPYCYALGTIPDTNVGTNETAYLDSTHTSELVHFKTNWYYYSGGSVQFKVVGYNMGTTGYDSMSGTAN